MTKVTISSDTLQIIAEEQLDGIPDDWSSNDFFMLMDEGTRFFAERPHLN